MAQLGGSSYLDLALEFARQGADVALHYKHSQKGAMSAVEEITSPGRRATAFQANFDCLEEATALANQAMDFLGGIDCLVNNTGITMNKPFLNVTREQFDRLIHVNTRSPFFVAQRIVQHMIEHAEGAIVNLTSIHGLQGAPEHSVYAATKGAIISLYPHAGYRTGIQGSPV